jgi:hypothetical protein
MASLPVFIPVRNGEKSLEHKMRYILFTLAVVSVFSMPAIAAESSDGDEVNAKTIISNQGKILGNQEKIIGNQEKIIGNQKKLDQVLENQKKLDQVLENQKKLDQIIQHLKK